MSRLRPHCGHLALALVWLACATLTVQTLLLFTGCSQTGASATGPVITTQPVAVTVTEGGSAHLEVVATGTGTLSYHWYKGGTVVSGASKASLDLTPVLANDAGIYYVVVTDGTGTAVSHSVTLTVLLVAPVITVEPVPLVVAPGDQARFSVTVTSGTDVTYQWYKDGAALTGRTEASCVLTAVTSADAGAYSVQVSNSGGTTVSAEARLTVSPG